MRRATAGGLIVRHAADQIAGRALEQVAQQQERRRLDTPDVRVFGEIVATLNAEPRQVREAVRGQAMLGELVGQVPSNSHVEKVREILRLDNSQVRPYYPSDTKRSLTMTATQTAILAHLKTEAAAGRTVRHSGLQRAVRDRFVFAELALLWNADVVNVFGGVITLAYQEN